MKYLPLKQLLISILIVLLLLSTGEAKAQETIPVGLDVVFLVDQSGSMGGAEAGCGAACAGRVNDPGKLRFTMPEFTIKTLLGKNLFEGQGSREVPVDIQVSVINFGSGVDVALEPYLIQARTPEEWEDEWNDIQAELLASRAEWTTDNLGKTNHKAAFTTAIEVFAEMANNPAALQGKRLKAIVLLTDGAPCAEDCDPPENDWGQTEIQAYLQELLLTLRGDSGQPGALSQDYNILVIAMLDQNDDSWAWTEDLWQQITNQNAHKVDNETEASNQLYTFFNPLLAEIGGRTGAIWEFGVPQQVRPYLQSITFSVFKSFESEAEPLPIQIEENGVSLDLTNNTDSRIVIQGSDDSLIRTIEISNPQPGHWVVFQTSDANVSVWASTLEFQVFPTINSEGNNQQFFPLFMEFSLRDEGGNPPPTYVDTRYALQTEVALTWGDQTATPALTSSGEGHYETEFVPVEAATYNIHLLVTTNNVSTGTITLVDTDISSFTISPLTVSSTAFDEAWYQNVPVTTSFQIEDEQGIAISEPENYPWEVVLRASGPDDEPVVSFTQDSGVYTTQFTPQTGGEYQLFLTITGADHNDVPFTLFDGSLRTFVVRPTTSLDFGVTTSFTGSVHVIQADIGWLNWRFGGVGESQPYSLTVQLQTENGTPIAATAVGEGNNQPFQATLHAPDGTEQTIALQATNQPGMYQALVNTLVPTGTWTLDVTLQLNLVTDYLMNQESKTLTFNLVENPTALRYRENWAFWFPKITGFLILLILALIIRRLIQARNPCQGQLLVEDEYGAPLFTFDLRSKRRNRIKVGKNKLPASTQLKGLDIYRPSGSPGVVVTATLRDGAQPLTSRPMVHEDQAELTPDGLYIRYLNYASMTMDVGSTDYGY